jgi:hypothetical protein
MSELREVFADFARLEERPGIGLSVPLGREDRTPELAQLREGERVLLVEPDNLCAEGTVKLVDSGGYRYWFGILASMEAIRDIDPDTLAAQERAASIMQDSHSRGLPL